MQDTDERRDTLKSPGAIIGNIITLGTPLAQSDEWTGPNCCIFSVVGLFFLPDDTLLYSLTFHAFNLTHSKHIHINSLDHAKPLSLLINKTVHNVFISIKT